MNETFEPAIKFFENLGTDMGWLSNLLGIVIPLGTGGLILYKYLKNKNKNKKAEHSDFSSMLSEIFKGCTSKIYKTKSVAIVDDNPENYPIPYLNQSGYNITSIESVSLANIDHLLKYDLLILDITNIVVEDPKKGGLTLLKKLKSEKPDILTIAASSKRYDPTLTEFFKLADDQIKTPIEPEALEEKIINVLNYKYCPIAAAKRLDDSISGKDLSFKQKQKIISLSRTLIEGKISEEDFLKKTASFSHLADTRKLKDELKTVVDMQ
ncbi:hypothetical protein ACUIA4_17945 [Vibrio parahaemolyticus]